MYVPFEQLPEYSRIWTYQLNRAVTPEEEEALNARLQAFVTEWSSHGRDLQASFEIRNHQFLFLATNERVATASGCSIDKSVNFLKQLGQEFGVDFFDRSQLAFQEGGRVQLFPMSAIKKAVAEGKLSADSLYFDTLVDTVGALQAQWPKPAKDTWLARYF